MSGTNSRDIRACGGRGFSYWIEKNAYLCS